MWLPLIEEQNERQTLIGRLDDGGSLDYFGFSSMQ
jgi:hypothetical protein